MRELIQRLRLRILEWQGWLIWPEQDAHYWISQCNSKGGWDKPVLVKVWTSPNPNSFFFYHPTAPDGIVGVVMIKNRIARVPTTRFKLATPPRGPLCGNG